MVTLFTTTKDFLGIFNIIQTNALNSWRAISPSIQIIILGNSYGSKETEKKSFEGNPLWIRPN